MDNKSGSTDSCDHTGRLLSSQHLLWHDLHPQEMMEKEQMLETMKTEIEQLDKQQHIEILKIFKKFPQIKINENRNGVYINLSYVSKQTIDELAKYLEYVKDQEQNLEQFETKKEEFRFILE